MSADCAVHLEAIRGEDVDAVAHFLHAHLNSRLGPAAWAASLIPPWSVDSPNHGFMLTVGGEVVGAHLAFYSERKIAGRTERFCNLAAWCVLEEYRAHSLRLLRALLAQPGLHFTDLSPSGAVAPLNARLRFEALDTTTTLVPNLPWPSRSRRTRVTSDLRVIADAVRGNDQRIFRDHRQAAAARHLLVTRGDDSCYLILRRDRRRNLPLFASILHVGNPALFREVSGEVYRHLLVRHGVLGTLAEHRVVGFAPGFGHVLRRPRPKMYKSTRLSADEIDYLYSELTCVAW